MQSSGQSRIRRRLPCTLNLPTGDHNGIVTNLSPSGLFVQTAMPLRPGSWIQISLPTPDHDDTIALEAKVVWRRRAPRTSPGFALNGMGVEIRRPPQAYEQLMVGIAPASMETPRPKPRAQATLEAGPHWIVRLGLRGSPRSKRSIVRAVDAEGAAQTALSEVDDRWCILEIDRHD